MRFGLAIHLPDRTRPSQERQFRALSLPATGDSVQSCIKPAAQVGR